LWQSRQDSTYSSAGNNELNLAAVRAHQDGELVHNTLKGAQTVVGGESLEEVLDDALLVGSTEVLLQFLDNLLLVRDGEGGGVQDLGELGVLLEDGRERLERLGRGVESVGLCRRGELSCGKLLA
jgi:hypothetical protein